MQEEEFRRGAKAEPHHHRVTPRSLNVAGNAHLEALPRSYVSMRQSLGTRESRLVP